MNAVANARRTDFHTDGDDHAANHSMRGWLQASSPSEQVVVIVGQCTLTFMLCKHTHQCNVATSIRPSQACSRPCVAMRAWQAGFATASFCSVHTCACVHMHAAVIIAPGSLVQVELHAYLATHRPVWDTGLTPGPQVPVRVRHNAGRPVSPPTASTL